MFGQFEQCKQISRPVVELEACFMCLCVYVMCFMCVVCW